MIAFPYSILIILRLVVLTIYCHCFHLWEYIREQLRVLYIFLSRVQKQAEREAKIVMMMTMKTVILKYI